LRDIYYEKHLDETLLAYTKYLGKDELSYDIANEFKNFCKDECNIFIVCKGFILNVDNTTNLSSVSKCRITKTKILLKNITIYDYPMFTSLDFSKLDRQYPYTTALRLIVPILYGDQICNTLQFTPLKI